MSLKVLVVLVATVGNGTAETERIEVGKPMAPARCAEIARTGAAFVAPSALVSRYGGVASFRVVCQPYGQAGS